MQKPYKKSGKIKNNYEEIAKLIGENENLKKQVNDMDERIKELYKTVNQLQSNIQEGDIETTDIEKFDVRKFKFGIDTGNDNWVRLSTIYPDSLVWDDENQIWRFYAVYAP